MPELRAFRGLRYAARADLDRLVCPPYDVVSAEQRERLYERHPHNALHLELARGEGPARHAAAGRAFDEWVAKGVLLRDDEPCLYVYRQDLSAPDGGRRRVAGVMGALELEELGATSGVLPHERTMPGPKKDRLALMRALPANVSPIYAIYRGGGGLGPYFDSLAERPPDARFTDDDGTLQRLWVVRSPAEIELLRGAVGPGPLVIADGHHRYETALAYRAEHPDEDGAAAIMCFCVDADAEGLVVLPYNRVLRTSAAPELAERLRVRFGARQIALDEGPSFLAGAAAHPFVFVLPDETLAVEVGDAAVDHRLRGRAAAWRALDVVVLHEAVLADVLPEGIDDLGFSRDPGEVVRLVRDEGWSAGVLLRALHPAEVVDVARSGERMPQKASYFWPKAVTGLVFRPTR
ncbi:MAG: DUF1015 family protein [Actinomycetota bacterium]